jgi:GT2 family glycosyltransferase
MSELPKASVIVCTYNRARILARSVPALLAIDYPVDRWELLIVDNRSTDDTLRVARETAGRRPERVRVIEEPRIGLSTARNAGVRNASGEFIVFADDDAFPTSGWLRALIEALQRDSRALVAGGPVEPWFDGELPGWLGERFMPYLTAWERVPEVHSLTYNDYPRGANMAFRREVFERFGYFSPHLGRKGRSLLSCEEVELCLRVERGGGRILYVPEARVRHLTAAERITPEWLAQRFCTQGRSEAIVEWRHAGWRGLAWGRRRWWRMYREAVRRRSLLPDGEIYARCLRQAFLGHSWGVLGAPLTVPRYRPTQPALEWPS